MSETTKHDRIYLQVCDHEGDENFDCEFGDEITWCKDRINDSDVEYIRSDLVEKQRAELLSTVMAARRVIESAIRSSWDGCTDEDINDHITIKRIDAAIARAKGESA